MKLLFGGLISVILLGIYVHLITVAVKVAICVSAVTCTTKYQATYFNEGMAQALSIIGGLVSALVIAELAIAKPGHPPASRALADNASTLAIRTVTIVSTFYILVWVTAGLTAFFVGLYHPKALPTLTTYGQAWLGLSISAAYAYFGLTPTDTASRRT